MNPTEATTAAANMMSKCRYFSFDPDDGIEFHETAQEAKDRARRELGYAEDAASDGWEESVEDICWGEVAQKVEETGRRPAPSDAEFDFEVEYALMDVKPDIVSASIAPHAVRQSHGTQPPNLAVDALRRFLAAHDAEPQAVWEGNRGTLGRCEMTLHCFDNEAKWIVDVDDRRICEDWTICTAVEAQAMCEAVARVYLAHHPEAQQQKDSR